MKGISSLTPEFTVGHSDFLSKYFYIFCSFVEKSISDWKNRPLNVYDGRNRSRVSGKSFVTQGVSVRQRVLLLFITVKSLPFDYVSYKLPGVSYHWKSLRALLLVVQ